MIFTIVLCFALILCLIAGIMIMVTAWDKSDKAMFIAGVAIFIAAAMPLVLH